MERRPTSILTTLAVSVLALTLIAPASLGQNPDAIPEIRRLAEQGDVDAQFDLGFMYATGEGVPENDAEAVKWYRLAADQGHVRAKHNLGFMYATGEGVPQDDAYAVRWFRLAAEQGDARAQSLLGGMYADGRGVPQDDAEAVRWYRPWADRGYADAQRSRSARLNVEPLGRRLGHCEEGNRGGGEAVPLNQIEKLSRTLPSCRTRLNVASLVLLCLLGVLATGCGRQPDTPRLEVFPKHFLLHRGEQIHYSVVDPFDDSQLSVDYDLIIEDPRDRAADRAVGDSDRGRSGRAHRNRGADPDRRTADRH